MNRRLWDRAARGVGSRVWYLFLLGFFWGWGGLGELWGGGWGEGGGCLGDGLIREGFAVGVWVIGIFCWGGVSWGGEVL